jgi:hypothetical protein
MSKPVKAEKEIVNWQDFYASKSRFYSISFEGVLLHGRSGPNRGSIRHTYG